MITVNAADNGSLERAAKMLQGINGGLEKALRSAASRTTSHLRTQSTKAIRERYAISAANIKANESISMNYSYSNGVQATVTFRGGKIPLAKFTGSSSSPSRRSDRVPVPLPGGWKLVRPSNPAKGHQLKGTSPTTFRDAFVAKMSSGHVGIFERTGAQTSGDSAEIKELMGSSVPQMLGSEQVQEKLAQEAVDKFSERLDHEVLAILNGWR